jgi:large subunit ribosomal protein L30
MAISDFLGKKIIVEQVKSGSKFNDKQKGSLIGLGLRGIGSTSELKCDESIAGMVRKVEHVIKVKLA